MRLTRLLVNTFATFGILFLKNQCLSVNFFLEKRSQLNLFENFFKTLKFLKLKFINFGVQYLARQVFVNFNTVEHPISDHPKCQAYVVAYGGWLLTRNWMILGQNFASLAYGNCRDFPQFPPKPM